MRYSKINPQLFIENRKTFCKKLKPNSLAIFHSNDEMPKKGDQFFKFRQNPNFFYMSGIAQEKSVLVLFPDSPLPEYKEVLFLLKTNELIAIWEGHKFSKDEATEISGIKTVKWLDEMDMIMNQLMSYADNVYQNRYEYPKYSSDVESREKRLNRELKQKFPNHSYLRSAPLVYEQRLIKSPIEIELIRQACEITNKAFRRTLRFVKPGVKEYEIQAETDHEFTINRANGHAYEPIIASGENSCVLHYVENDKECVDGDLLLFDFGAEYAEYAADMSRTIPVNGKFTYRQKAVYEAVLRTLNELTRQMTVGTTIAELDKTSKKLIEKELIGLGLFSEEEVKNQDSEKPLYQKYFMHGVNHHLGLDVHDVGDRLQPFKEGMVLTCEPGIYISEERIGIRLENDILITNEGPVNLMADIPIEADTIELLMYVNIEK
jgi:Xaa-Pro aminopeptidase